MMNSLWEIICLASLTVVGLEIFVSDPNKPRHHLELCLGTVNFLLFIFASTCFMVFLGLFFQGGRVFYLSVGTGVACLVAVLLLIIWVIPFRTIRPSTKGADLGADTTESLPLTEQQRRLPPKLFYSMVLFLLPLLLIAHVHRNSDYYLDTLGDYETYLSVQSTNQDLTKVESQPVNSETSPAKANRTSPPKNLASYVRAISLHFLTSTKLICQEKDTFCVNLQNRLSKVQDGRALFLVKVLFYFIVFFLILRYYAQVIQATYDYETSDQQGLGLRQDVIKQCSQIASVSAAFLVALIIAGVDFTSLGVFGGLIGAGLSVALKDMLGNLVAGILLLWDKTIKKKDVITVAPSDSSDTGGTYAIVEKMTMRYTVVQDRNEVRRLIPNSLLTNSIVENWTHEDNKVRLRVLVGVDYGTDLRLARTILESVCYEVDRVFTKDRYAPKAVVIGFGDYSINFALRFWIEDAYKGIRPVLSDLYIAIHERLKEEGINIPYPRQDLRIISQGGTYRLHE